MFSLRMYIMQRFMLRMVMFVKGKMLDERRGWSGR